MTSSSLRRQMKNIVNNYSEAEIKVREATSNDPWGPSSSLMAEISDLTYNVVAFSEIMSMIWKRLNDHGKNWRHVYKALMLMDYLIKTGSERVAQQCKENIFAIQTLKDFQYIDRDGRDQGVNVREKSKQLIALLKDDERLRVERSHALKTKERMSSVTTGVGSNNQIMFGRGSSHPNLSTSQSDECGKVGGSPASYHGSTSPKISSELEQTRPQTSGEEELQLQLALAMSREEAEQIFKCATTTGSQSRNTVTTLAAQEERRRRGGDLRLQLALEESRQKLQMPGGVPHRNETALLDLTDSTPSPLTQKPDPWGTPFPSASTAKPNPWAAVSRPVSADPWKQMAGSRLAVTTTDPWGASSHPPSGDQQTRSTDPWASVAPASDRDPWAPTSPPGPSPFHSLNAAEATVMDDFSAFSHLRGSPKKAEGQAAGGRYDAPGDAMISVPTSGDAGCPDSFDMSRMPGTMGSRLPTPKHQQKNPESFLGPNASLVNLDTLVTRTTHPNMSTNPFLMQGVPAVATANPFHSAPAPVSSSMMAVTQTPFGPVNVSGGGPFSSMPGVGVPPMVTMPAMGMPQGASVQGMMGPTYVAMPTPPAPGPAPSSTNPFLL
ncbi:epsin-2-like isoform X1 [Leucoraja erinacea]|uniref:epsin-2-like isoform X1 n=1 Tax=Leucoraja erinaceus TaxID=7782 RepID=UPI002456E453|nr:epsin-2-like isoform X1 [Leucoraja erinacea]XP_055519075.1 epsin-2-like isoform X1 [Leucoraja erinacea]